jgi:hypothetical protein
VQEFVQKSLHAEADAGAQKETAPVDLHRRRSEVKR